MGNLSAGRPCRPGSRWLVTCMLVFTGAMLFHGCAAPGKRLEAPRITVTRVEVQHATVFETVMNVTLRIFNTNEVPLTVKGADISFEINGRDVAHGVSQIEITLPAYDTALVPMTLYSSMIDIIKGVLKIKKRETIKYRIHGNIRIEGGFLLPSSLPFSSEGEIALEGVRPRK